jgi:hypothetical protein
MVVFQYVSCNKQPKTVIIIIIIIIIIILKVFMLPAEDRESNPQGSFFYNRMPIKLKEKK